MCYGSGCPHERWDGECGRKFKSDICMMEYEDEKSYQEALEEQEAEEEDRYQAWIDNNLGDSYA